MTEVVPVARRPFLRTDSRPLVRWLLRFAVALQLAYFVALLIPGTLDVLDNALSLAVEGAAMAACWCAVALSRTNRLAPALASAAITATALGDALFIAEAARGGAPIFPAPSDGAYLLFYLLLLAAVVTVGRQRLRNRSSSVAFDVTIGTLGFAAVLALVLTPVLDTAGAGSDVGELLLVAAYPLLDLLLVAAIVGVGASDRSGAPWLPLTIGLALFAAADIVYALQLPGDDYVLGTLLDSAWSVALLFMAFWVCRATDHPHPAQRRVSSTRVGTLLALCAMVAALLVLVVAPSISASVVSVALATATLSVTVVSVAVKRRTAALVGVSGRRLRTLEQLRSPRTLEQIVLHYQPKLRLSTDRIEGVEALARWEHPVRGLLGPAEFVPLLEESGASRAWTEHILALALDDAARWRRNGHALTVAVNVTADFIADPEAVAGVLPAVRARSLPPSVLTLEITEQALVADPVAALGALEPLRAEGVRVSLDDFGTGFNSLSALHGLTVDELKIDRSFVETLETDRRALSLVRATVGLARELGCDSVAEGVQNQAQATALREMGCTFAQGYLIAKPLPSRQIDDLLSSPGTHPPSTGSAL
jgi:EAL domain-containing protein (putative c-di-GMP-specific phosphodiesterase class I)